MPAFRTTPSTFWASFYAHLQTLENTVGSGSTQSIRKVAEGERLDDEYPAPWILCQVISFKAAGRADVDKQWAMRIKLRIVSNITTAAGSLTEILSKIAQVNDKLDAYTRPDGVSGLENPEWSISFDTSSSPGSRVRADALIDVILMVARGAN